MIRLSVMLRKRSQITAFIIVGLVIVLLFGLLMYIQSAREEYHIKESIFDTSEIEYYIQLSIDQAAEDSLLFTGLMGGNYDLNRTYDTETYFVNYLYDGQVSYLPSLDRIEEDMEAFVDYVLPFYINLAVFEEKGYDIKLGNVSTDVVITQNAVDFIVDYPISVEMGDRKKTLEKFKTTFDVRLGYIYHVAENIVNQQFEDPGWIDVTYLDGLKAMQSDLSYLSEDTVLFALQDKLSEKPFYFIFVLKLGDKIEA